MNRTDSEHQVRLVEKEECLHHLARHILMVILMKVIIYILYIDHK